MQRKQIITADLNQILFEGRNKEYGAYPLRKRQTHYLMRSALIALIVFLCLTAVPQGMRWANTQPLAMQSSPDEQLVENWKWVEMPMPPPLPKKAPKHPQH